MRAVSQRIRGSRRGCSGCVQAPRGPWQLLHQKPQSNGKNPCGQHCSPCHRAGMSTEHLTRRRRAVGPTHLASKVPEVTVYFWVIKVLTTGMGETASDLLAKKLGPIPAVGLGGLALVVALFVQLKARRYV